MAAHQSRRVHDARGHAAQRHRHRHARIGPTCTTRSTRSLIAELTASCAAARRRRRDVRVVVLTGNGPSFCAGADLNWMKKMAGYSRAENVADATGLAAMLRTLNELPKPTVARIHGPAYGGGVGPRRLLRHRDRRGGSHVRADRKQARPHSGHDLAVCHRSHRRAPGAALFPHRRALRGGGGVSHRARARHRADRAARRSRQRDPRAAAGRRAERAARMQGADPRGRAPADRRQA